MREQIDLQATRTCLPPGLNRTHWKINNMPTQNESAHAKRRSQETFSPLKTIILGLWKALTKACPYISCRKFSGCNNKMRSWTSSKATYNKYCIFRRPARQQRDPKLYILWTGNKESSQEKFIKLRTANQSYCNAKNISRIVSISFYVSLMTAFFFVAAVLAKF